MLVHQLLHPMQDRLPFRHIGLRNLPVEQFIDVGIAAIGIAATLDNEGLHPGGGIAERSAATLDNVALFLVGISLQKV
jgi:hypothetical protein